MVGVTLVEVKLARAQVRGLQIGRHPGVVVEGVVVGAQQRGNAASLRLSGVRQPVVDHFCVTCCVRRAGMAELL